MYPDKIAVVFNDKCRSYQEFYDRVNQLASALKKAGVGGDDKVAFICQHPTITGSHYAAPLIGAVLVSINVRLSANEIAHILNHSESKIAFGELIIHSGGENISSVEVENTLYNHPDVLEVAVVASPDSKWGEVPKAFIALKTKSEASEEEIIEFCKQNLARYKAPKKIEFTDLPKTATGKIQKFVLRQKEKE